jgi:hypothetical protein
MLQLKNWKMRKVLMILKWKMKCFPSGSGGKCYSEFSIRENLCQPKLIFICFGVV